MVIFPGGIQANAVIFDFDGVIVDTEPLHYKAFQQILLPLGLGFSWELYLETYMGFDDRDAFMEAFKSKGQQLSHDELIQLIATKAAIFQEVIRAGVTPYPGVIDLIKTLHSTNTPLAICSGALHSDIMPILEMLDISVYFGIVVTAEEVVKSKPDPECYRLAFERVSAHWPLVTLPAQAIAIEDTPAGITAASKAGLQVIAVTNSYQRNFLSDATITVESLEQLVAFETVERN
ncbi:MAG: HAD family hydrolase [Desulfuromonadales bacterium GWD2_54_10]|nr:MAG: HAD family hydrolase [Desulfuromonadales bacterium GWD2_54_10]